MLARKRARQIQLTGSQDYMIGDTYMTGDMYMTGDANMTGDTNFMSVSQFHNVWIDSAVPPCGEAVAARNLRFARCGLAE